ncbi:CobW family GTP-binding protein [Aureimonas populi]|uniref:CobW family GTP-binding protein n=1 Tax=Aureimonas populi TaxID=1701758 RepID=A0ABW5CRR9_9HYPH|nr:GTP-binding protein [Aureimonas populi]
MSGPTPVHLLTGFLGSGKTTLLRGLLTDPAMASAAVLVNEFGEIGLDHELLERVDETVVLMKSGCVCCTVRGELADAMLSLHSRRARGEVPFFERVVIETTGMADPYPALSTIQSHPVVRSHYRVANVVTTVDAVNAPAQMATRLEALRQVGAADLLVLTKTDLADPDGAAALHARLAEINPSARLIEAREAVAEDFLAQDAERVLRVPAAAALAHHGAFRAEAPVTSFALEIETPLDWTAFGLWLAMLLHRHGEHIFRVKGILCIEGEERPVAVHGVQRLVHAPVHLERWPDGRRLSRIVFIVNGLDHGRIEASFRAFEALSQRVLSRQAAA